MAVTEEVPFPGFSKSTAISGIFMKKVPFLPRTGLNLPRTGLKKVKSPKVEGGILTFEFAFASRSASPCAFRPAILQTLWPAILSPI